MDEEVKLKQYDPFDEDFVHDEDDSIRGWVQVKKHMTCWC